MEIELNLDFFLIDHCYSVDEMNQLIHLNGLFLELLFEKFIEYVFRRIHFVIEAQSKIDTALIDLLKIHVLWLPWKRQVNHQETGAFEINWEVIQLIHQRHELENVFSIRVIVSKRIVEFNEVINLKQLDIVFALFECFYLIIANFLHLLTEKSFEHLGWFQRSVQIRFFEEFLNEILRSKIFIELIRISQNLKKNLRQQSNSIVVIFQDWFEQHNVVDVFIFFISW